MIDVFLKGGSTSDFSSALQIKTAAASIISACTQRSERFSGGYLRDIGEYLAWRQWQTLSLQVSNKYM